jgi:hypothetical protein
MPTTAVEAARQLAEAVRAANHATRVNADELHPDVVDQIIGDINLAITRLPQLMQQLAAILEQLAARPGLVLCDSTGGAATLTRGAARLLDDSGMREALGIVARRTALAAKVTSRLTTAGEPE